MKRTYLIASFFLLLCACQDARDTANKAERSLSPAEERGKSVFMSNCAACHSPHKDATGPALKGSLARWGNDTTRLWAFIRNPYKEMQGKDPRILAMFEKYKPTLMTAFPGLTDNELSDLFYYIELVPPPPPPGTVVASR